MKTSLARFFIERCPQKTLRPVIGTGLVIWPFRSVIGTRSVISTLFATGVGQRRIHGEKNTVTFSRHI